MIIDVHGHVTAPDKLYVYKAGIISHRGAHGRGSARRHRRRHQARFERAGFRRLLASRTAQGSRHGHAAGLAASLPDDAQRASQSREAGSSKRPTTSSTGRPSSTPTCSAECADCRRAPESAPRNCLPELERCVKQLGFVGCLINPDPGEASGIETPPLGDRFWYPLYEKLVELDIAGHVHSAGCRSDRLPYSLHFINEESIGVVSLLELERLSGFPHAEDSGLARRRRDSLPLGALRSRVIACAAAGRAFRSACAISTTTRCSIRATLSNC